MPNTSLDKEVELICPYCLRNFSVKLADIGKVSIFCTRRCYNEFRKTGTRKNLINEAKREYLAELEDGTATQCLVCSRPVIKPKRYKNLSFCSAECLTYFKWKELKTSFEEARDDYQDTLQDLSGDQKEFQFIYTAKVLCNVLAESQEQADKDSVTYTLDFPYFYTVDNPKIRYKILKVTKVEEIDS